MPKKSVIVSIVFFILASVTGVCGNGESGFVLKRHEFSVTGGFFQAMNSLWPPDLNTDNSALLSDDYILSMAGVSEYGKSRMTGTWKLAYTYNATRVIAVEASLNYEGYRDNYFDSDTGLRTKAFYADVFCLMASLRANWLNRRLVRVYSSAGVGISGKFSGGNYRRSGGPLIRYDNIFRVGWQTVPIGVTIGRSLYGIAELGFGTVCVGARFGIGYRF